MREKGFAPEEVIFAPTSRCNLSCAHCRVTRMEAELDIDASLAFLGDCADNGIELLGFSGGEPFFRPDFLSALCDQALKLDMRFDRLMTNGDWWEGEAELRRVLAQVAESGFDGTIGLSADGYHGRGVERLATFLKACFEAFGSRSCARLACVVNPKDPDGNVFLLEGLARALGGRFLVHGDGSMSIEEAKAPRFPSSDGEALSLPIDLIPYSASAAEGASLADVAATAEGGSGADGVWGATEWFTDDFCLGPGNVLYVHPDSRVAACCGFANERPELILGEMANGYEALMARADSSPAIRARYIDGLDAARRALEAGGHSFPGKTADQCFFCDYLCAHPELGRGSR
jgi:hypothetical protein